MFSARWRQFSDRFGFDREMTLTRRHIVVAALAAVVCFGFIFSVAMRMEGPTVHPDEFGFLTNGQVLLGHDEASIPTGSFYPAGYGVVTAVGALMTGSIAGAYRFALFFNLGCALLTAWCAGLTARRAFDASPMASRLVSLLVLVMPGTLVSAMFSWPEILIRLAFLGLVMSVVSVARNTSASKVVALGLYIGLLPGLHGRFTLLVPVMMLFFAWWAYEKLITRGTALIAACFSVVGYLAARALNRYVKSTVYLESYNQENRLIARLFRPWVWPALIRTMVGQSWYLLATTFGLAGIAIGYAVVAVRRARKSSVVSRDARLTGLLFVVVSSAAVIFTGGLQLLYGNRGDHLIYGRYVEMLVPILIVVACVALEKAYREAQLTWLISVIGIVAIAFVYVLVDGGDGIKGSHSRRSIVYPNIVGIDFLRYFITPMFITFGIAFCLIACAFWFGSRKFGMWSLVAILCFYSLGTVYSGQRTMLSRTNKLEQTTESIQGVKDSGTSLVGYDGGIRNDMAYYYLRYRLHPIKLERHFFSIPSARDFTEYSCVYGFGNKPPTQGEWAVVAQETVLERVLWKRVNAASC